MPDPMNIAVLGPVPRDNITTYQGERLEKFGCAVYTAVCISALAGPESTISLVSHVRRADTPRIRELLGPFPNIDLTHLHDETDQGDVIELTYVDQNRRLEKQTGFMRPILPGDIDDLMGCGAFVFVPITDFEVPLETLRHIKANSDGVIVFDAHGPTNGVTTKGDRHHRFWIDRDRWLPYIDILKMNLEEARCAWFDGEVHGDDPDELTMDDLPRFAEHCLGLGVKALYVTLDQHGCAVYFRSPDGKFREHVVKRVRVDHVVDTTGCGDSFAGGLAYGYLTTRDFVKACWFGNCAGAQRCTSSELDVYYDLAGTERQIAETYLD